MIPPAGEPTPLPLAERQSPSGQGVTTSSRFRVVLAHDWLVGYRGGEAVLVAIAAALLAAGHAIPMILTMFDDGNAVSPRIDTLPRRTSFLSRMPGSGALRRWMLPMYPRAVEELSAVLAAEHARQQISLVISTSSAAIKGLRTPPGVAHLCYCHTPARYLWSQTDQYTRGSGGTLRAIGLRAFGGRLREWDKSTAKNVARFVANSTHTSRMITQCYGRDSRVIFPPVRIDFFTPPPPSADTRRSGWIYAGALEPYKRVDLATDAAIIAKRTLTIVGDGSQIRALRAKVRATGAQGLVQFEGRISDEDLRERYRAAKVLLFPQVEDFGIVAVEAQACGTPVAAIGQGGALDTVVPGVTGQFAESRTPKSLAEAALSCERLPAPAQHCREHAQAFGEATFRERVLAEIDQLFTHDSRD